MEHSTRQCHPTAVKSKIYYQGHFRLTFTFTQNDDTILHVMTSTLDNLELEGFWKLKSLVISSSDDGTTFRYLEDYQTQSISFASGRYIEKLHGKTMTS